MNSQKIIQLPIECGICKRRFKNLRALSAHIHHSKCKSSVQDYYDQFYLKSESEKKCYVCNKPTTFINMTSGYHKYCSSKCMNACPEVISKRKHTNIDRYGEDNIFKTVQFFEKRKASCLIKFGVEHQSQSPEIQNKKKETCLKHFGVDHQFKSEQVQSKSKKSMLERYGVEYFLSSSSARQKSKDTCIIKYGVDHPLKSSIIQKKIKITCMKRFGETTNLKCNDTKNKIKITCLKRYGVDHITKTCYVRRKLRESMLRRIESQYCNGEPLGPNIGTHERQCLDKLQENTEFQIKRNIPIIGYFPDGTIEELKIIIEFDEQYHFKENNCYIDHDIKRQNDLENEGYIFFRIKEVDWLNNQVNEIERFKEFIEKESISIRNE